MPKSLDQIAREVAQRYGLSYPYVRGLIQYESKGDPTARSPTGARGLTQFTRGTGRAYGLNRRNVNDPEANVDAAGQLARDNIKSFERRMGRRPTDEELYLTHLQGAGGATSGLKRPDEPAVTVFGEDKVIPNLPRHLRSRLNDITAKEFQELHKGNISKAMSPYREISDTPTLDQLQPPKPTTDTQRVPISLMQLAPTEQSTTMARHPSYDQAIRSALDEVSEGGRGNLRDQVRVAGLLPPIRGPGGKMRPNPMNVPGAAAPRRGLPKPEDVPGVRTAPGIPESEIRRRAIERQQQLRTKGDRAKRGDEVEIEPQQGGPAIQGGSSQATTPAQPGSTAPIQPRSVPTETFRKGATAASAGGVGAATTVAGSGKDPAVSAVEDVIRGRGGQELDPMTGAPVDRGSDARARQPTGGDPLGAGPQRPYRAPSIDQDMVGGALQQIAPVMREVQKDPAAAQVVQRAAVEITKAKARVDAQQGDARNDPTYYQMLAARGQMPGGMQDDRAMERAVMMDNARRSPTMGRQAVARGIQNVPQQPPAVIRATPQEQGDVATQLPPVNVAGPRRVPTRGVPPSEFPAQPPGAEFPVTPMAVDRGYPMQAPSPVGQVPGQMMDPTMMQLMKFFTGQATGGTDTFSQ